MTTDDDLQQIREALRRAGRWGLLAAVDRVEATLSELKAALRHAATICPWTHGQDAAEKACARLGIELYPPEPAPAEPPREEDGRFVDGGSVEFTLTPEGWVETARTERAEPPERTETP